MNNNTQPSPTVRTSNKNENYKQLENYEIVGEISDKEKLLELLKFSMQLSATVCCANTTTLPLLIEDKQTDIEFNRRAVKKNGMANS